MSASSSLSASSSSDVPILEQRQILMREAIKVFQDHKVGGYSVFLREYTPHRTPRCCTIYEHPVLTTGVLLSHFIEKSAFTAISKKLKEMGFVRMRLDRLNKVDFGDDEC